MKFLFQKQFLAKCNTVRIYDLVLIVNRCVRTKQILCTLEKLEYTQDTYSVKKKKKEFFFYISMTASFK